MYMSLLSQHILPVAEQPLFSTKVNACTMYMYNHVYTCTTEIKYVHMSCVQVQGALEIIS